MAAVDINMGFGNEGGLYTPPPFPARLQSDSIRLNLSRMPNFLLWSGWNCPVIFWCLSGACLLD